MNRSVGIWIVLVGAALMAAIALSCRDDIEVPFPPSINGDYVGIYSFMEIENGADTTVDTSQLIEWRFRDGEYSMVMDGTIDEDLRVFCDVLGEYVLGNGVAMVINDSNFTRGVCTQYWGPGGYFGLDQPSDTMRLLHDSTAVVGGVTTRYIKRLRLVTD